METRGRISKYRDRLDRTLASPDLTNADTLKSLIKAHLQSTTLDGVEECSDGVLERRTSEVSNFLDMLRSASVKNEGPKAVEKSHADWKLKQDNEEFRVMYREGPPGTPFHTLLVEGYIEGPIDACLCVSWESSLYKKWWPQYHVPAFKIISSECLHKIRIGDEISLVRVKVSWPLSTREALVQFFEFEYFKDDLIIVLLNTIDEPESIDKSTHGYTRDMIPEAKDVVRIGAVGGFALQKVSPTRSYFRTIANMDLKLDFVPPSLINFISRQLIGSGFRLYQKAIASVFNSDEEFKKALADPLYSRIRDALYRSGEQDLKLEDKVPDNDATDNVQKTGLVEVVQELAEETSEEIHTVEVAQEDTEETNPKVHMDQNKVEVTAPDTIAQNTTTVCEIEEEGIEDSKKEERSHNTDKRKVYISPEVEQALGTLEKVIAMVREHQCNAHSRPSPSNEEDSEHQKEAEMEKSTPAAATTSLGNQAATEVLNKEAGERHLDEPRDSSSSHSLRSKKSNSLREVNHNKVAPASPLEKLVVPSQIDQVVLYSTNKDRTTESDHVLNDPVITREEEIKENGTDRGKKSRNRRRKYRLWCFHPSSRQPVV